MRWLQAHGTDAKTYRPEFVPELVVENACEFTVTPVPSGNGNPFRIRNGEERWDEWEGKVPRNCAQFRVEGTFMQRFDLSMFPVDQQELNIYVCVANGGLRCVRGRWGRAMGNGKLVDA